jgi:N-acyl-D-amino-acid deacylase
MPITRRRFIQTTSAVVLAAGSTAARRSSQQPPYALVIRGGTVFDGTGAEGIEADVAIAGGRIAAVGARLPEPGVDEIDARGRAVAPGFIDIHSHGDSSLREDPRAESLIRQGVTTIVVGQDGASRPQLLAMVESLNPAVNVAFMVGAGTLRAVTVGHADRPATGDELRRMTSMVETALAEGACGLSSGLEYEPGAFAPVAELTALCRPLARHRLPYATHMRNEDDRLLEAIDEAVAVARGAGCPLQISHLKTQGPRNWPKLDGVFARIEAAARGGLDVAFDRYPYLAYQTGLTNLFPIWSRDGGTNAFLARLEDAGVAPRIRAETLAKVDLLGGWDNVMVTGVRDPADRAAEGQRLGSYADRQGLDPYALAVALLQRSGGNVGMVGFAMSEPNLERLLAHPRGMVCSDGGAFAIDGPTRQGSPHPRSFGSFPRVLGRYVRERKALTLASAIYKMTALPASRVRLTDRGHLAVGQAADVVVFDPARVEDRATFEQPFQYPIGVDAVIVNGAVALRDGERGGAGTGRAVRPTV